LKLQHTPTLPEDLCESSIFIDSTSLIHASKSDEFLTLLSSIAAGGCSFYTIPSVVYEYTRTSNSLEGFKERLEFIKELGIIVFNRVEELIEPHRIFLVAYNREFQGNSRGPSYTDSLLCAMAYKHRGSSPYIMTANHKDMPGSIYDRTELITIDIGGELRTEALYQFSEERFGKVLNKIEKSY
jgi:hypothetical protein